MKVNLTVVSLAALLIIACLVLKGKGFTGPIPGRRGQVECNQQGCNRNKLDSYKGFTG